MENSLELRNNGSKKGFDGSAAPLGETKATTNDESPIWRLFFIQISIRISSQNCSFLFSSSFFHPVLCLLHFSSLFDHLFPNVPFCMTKFGSEDQCLRTISISWARFQNYYRIGYLHFEFKIWRVYWVAS